MRKFRCAERFFATFLRRFGRITQATQKVVRPSSTIIDDNSPRHSVSQLEIASYMAIYRSASVYSNGLAFGGCRAWRARHASRLYFLIGLGLVDSCL